MLLEESMYQTMNPETPSKSLASRQLFWNLSSRTPVYKRYVYGVDLPTSDVYKKITAKQVKLIGGSKVTLGERYVTLGKMKTMTCVYVCFLGHNGTAFRYGNYTSCSG